MSRRFRAIAIVVALAAAVVVVLHQARHSRTDAVGGPVEVLVATKLIQKGTPGDVIRTTVGYYRVTSIPRDEAENGAVVSAATLAGKVAVTNIDPGQMLTAAEFGGPCNCISTPGSSERALVITPRREVGHVSAGNHVDVWGATNRNAGTLRELYRHMYVLAVGAGGTTVTLRATPRQAGRLVYFATQANGRLVLRIHG